MYLSDRPPLAQTGVPRTRQGVARTVVLMGSVSLFTDVSSESVSSILPLYLTAVVGLSPFGYGVVDGLYQGVGALVRILGGWAADRSDHPKWIAFIGYGLSATTRLALIPLHSLAAITSVITVDRLGKGMRTGPRDVVIAASSPPESLGRAFGVHRAMDTLGAVIGPLLSFAILWAVPGDYRSVFVVSFAAAIIGLAVLFFFVPDVRPRRDSAAQIQSAQSQASPRPSLRLLADRRFSLLIAGASLLGILTVSDGFIYLALQQRNDLAIRYFPLLVVGTNIAYMTQAVPLGRLSDRVGRARVFACGHLALPLAYVCAGGLVTGPVVTVGCLVLLGTYYAATDGALAAVASRLVDPASRGTGIATAQTAQALSRFVSSIGFGLIWSLSSSRPALLIVAGLLAVAIPIAWLLLRQSEPTASRSIADAK